MKISQVGVTPPRCRYFGWIFRLYLKIEKVQVNEDKGEDKPGGCYSSPLPIFRLFLIIRRSRRRSRSTRTRVKTSQVGVTLPRCEILAVFFNTEEQKTVQVNEDKGEDRPGGCHSSPVPIFRLYLIDTEEQGKVQVNEDKGEDKPGGCHSSQVSKFRLYLIYRESRRPCRSTRTRVKISQVGVTLPRCRNFGCI